MVRLLLVCLLGTGCFAQATAGVTGTRGELTGGVVEAALGDAAVRGTVQLAAIHDVTDGGRPATAIGMTEGLRLSLPGIIFKKKPPDYAQWLDFGGDAGVGFGGSREGVYGMAYYGGWVDLRVWPADHGQYPTLRLQLREVGYVGGIANDTEWTIGVGWTQRDPNASFPRFD